MVGETHPPESSAFQEMLARAERAVHMINSYLLLNQISLPLGARRPELRANPGNLKPFALTRIDGPLVHRMAQHCLCDGIGFYEMYEMASVVWALPLGTVYEPILLAIGACMRAEHASRPYKPGSDPRFLEVSELQFEPADSIPVLSSSASSSGGPRRQWLKLEDRYLDERGLPSGHSYPLLDGLPLEELRLSHLLYSLMAYLAYNPESRAKYEAATLRLAELIPAYASRQHHVDGLCSRPRLAPVNLKGEVVALQAEETVLIALGKEDSGVAFQCYHPLCLDGCALLTGWSHSSWGHSQTARAQQGLTHRAFWPDGVKLEGAPLPPSTVWTQLAVARLYQGIGDRQTSQCQVLGFEVDELSRR